MNSLNEIDFGLSEYIEKENVQLLGFIKDTDTKTRLRGQSDRGKTNLNRTRFYELISSLYLFPISNIFVVCQDVALGCSGDSGF